MIQRYFVVATLILASFQPGSLAWGQVSPYVYVKMSLGVPWFLYFVFLLAILIPFILMIIFAWRQHIKSDKIDRDELN